MSRLRVGMCSTVCASGSLSWAFALSRAASISASVVTTSCSAMMLLPNKNQFVEMPCGCCQYVANVRLASVARPDGVCPVRERDLAVWAKIDDHLHVSVETMQCRGSWSIVYAANLTPLNRIEPICFYINPSPLG